MYLKKLENRENRKKRITEKLHLQGKIMKNKIYWSFVSLMLTSSFLLFLIGCSSMIDALSQDKRSFDFHETS